MQAVAIERRAYYELFESNLISETVFRELMLKIENLGYCIRNNEIPPFENFAIHSKTGLFQKYFNYFSKILITKKNRLRKLTQKIEFYVAIAKAGITVTKTLSPFFFIFPQI